ncbi:hypothetical protein D3C71_2022680 [compost metagenome]
MFFGVDVVYSENGVKYKVLINGEIIYEQTFLKANRQNNIIIPLNKYAGEKVIFQYQVDPLDDNTNDETYWINPQIIRITPVD